MATFFVNNLNDSGAGSLREALTTANSTPGTDSIVFNVSGQINLIDPLVITDDVRINVSGQTNLLDRLVIPDGIRINLPAIFFRTPFGIPFFPNLTPTITIDGTGLVADDVGTSEDEDIFQISNGATVEMNNLILNNAGDDAIDVRAIGEDGGGLKLSRVNIFNSGDDGIDFVSLESGDTFLQIIGSEIAQNGGDGIDVEGFGVTITLEGVKVYDNDDYGVDIDGVDLDIFINKSNVNDNGNSGLRLDDLENDDNSFTTLRITNSSFEFNGTPLEEVVSCHQFNLQ